MHGLRRWPRRCWLPGCHVPAAAGVGAATARQFPGPAQARAARPRERALARSRVSTALLWPAPRTHIVATQAAGARVSGSAAWRLSMRRNEGEAKCGHKACAVKGHARLRGSLGMLGEDRGPAHA